MPNIGRIRKEQQNAESENIGDAETQKDTSAHEMPAKRKIHADGHV